MGPLQNIPKPVLVLLILAGAALFIMLSDPPKDACDAQLEVFLSSQTGRLSSLKGKVNSLWARTAKYCQESKTLGGCAEFHETMRGVLQDLQSAPLECVSRLLSQESIRKTITDSLTLMVRMSWGEKLPDSGPGVYGWMGMPEFALFCKLSSTLKGVITDEEWEGLVRGTIKKLPGSKDVPFEEAFSRSLFSLRCEAVL